MDHTFLAQKLTGARSYRHIADYYRSLIFKLVGEEIVLPPDQPGLYNAIWRL